MKALLLFPILLALASCTSKEKKTETDGSVVTTIGMIADVTREIAGDKQEVTNIIGEGVDPHSYIPTKSDIESIQKAGLVLYLSLIHI